MLQLSSIDQFALVRKIPDRLPDLLREGIFSLFRSPRERPLPDLWLPDPDLWLLLPDQQPGLPRLRRPMRQRGIQMQAGLKLQGHQGGRSRDQTVKESKSADK